MVNDVFIIYVGTNNLINLSIQTFFWILLISFIRKNKFSKQNYSFDYFVSLIATSYFVTFMIYAEKRFYDSKIYLLDSTNNFTYLYIFSLILLLLICTTTVLRQREAQILNYLPFIYLIISVYTGFNFSFFFIIFIFYGILSLFKKNFNKSFNRFYLLFGSIWILNASNRYYFEPGKLRGFTSSMYDFNSVMSWTIAIFLIVNGILFLFKLSKKSLDINKVLNSFSISSLLILLFGYIGANVPIFNFLNYFYAGQQRFSIREINPFVQNEWGEKVSWRGYYSSAESIGEFYGLVIVLLIFYLIENKKLTKFNYIVLFFTSFGLYFSNNRTAFVLICLFISYFLVKKIKTNNYFKILISILTLISLGLVVGYQNLTLPYNFASEIMLLEAKNYKYDSITSSFLEFSIRSLENELLFSSILSFIGYVAYLLNRAELWGIFIARYNPSDIEVLFGSGSMNFGQLYGETLINKTESLFLPHSSFLSIIIFCGLFGLICLLSLLVFKIYQSNYLNYKGYFLIVYIVFNLIKNDTINYLPSFSLYLLLFLIIFNFDNSNF